MNSISFPCEFALSPALARHVTRTRQQFDSQFAAPAPTKLMLSRRTPALSTRSRYDDTQLFASPSPDRAEKHEGDDDWHRDRHSDASLPTGVPTYLSGQI